MPKVFQVIGFGIFVICVLVFGLVLFLSHSRPTSDAKELRVATYPDGLFDSSADTPGQAVTSIAFLIGVPGTVICKDYDDVSMVVDLYQNHWQELLADKMTKGQSRLLHGDPSKLPEPQDYGCALVPPGTPMTREPRNVIPVVWFRTADGRKIRGVTNPNMIMASTRANSQASPSLATLTISAAPTAQFTDEHSTPTETQDALITTSTLNEPLSAAATMSHSDYGPSNSAIVARQYRWDLQKNGDEALVGPQGQCAMLTVHQPDKVDVKFGDGHTGVFPSEDMQQAMKAAQEYCETAVGAGR